MISRWESLKFLWKLWVRPAIGMLFKVGVPVAVGGGLVAGGYIAGTSGVHLPTQQDLSKAYTQVTGANGRSDQAARDQSYSTLMSQKPASLAEQMRARRGSSVLDGDPTPQSQAPMPALRAEAPKRTATPASQVRLEKKTEPFEDVLVRYVRNFEALREATQSKADNRVDAYMIEREKLSLEISSRVSILAGAPRTPELDSLEAAQKKAESKAAIDDLYENLDAIQKK